ncbi:MAG: sulfatase [Candidatus Micrarchaeota archaeon]|nr:sulfatase [Candidatus Micrarchaeota archaeon]
MCDTLRKDIIDLYGGEARMPNLRKLAKDSMVYDNCIAPSPWTFPSHVSLFTGLYPSEHGIHETKDVKVEGLTDWHMKLDVERLPEQLRALGYNTLALSNNLMISRFTGFDRGFNLFLNLEPSPWSRNRVVREAKMLGSDIVQVAKELIRQRRHGEIIKFGSEYIRARALAKAIRYPVDKGAELTNSIIMDMKLSDKFFLFVNYYEAHDPYVGFSDKENQDNFTGVRPYRERRIAALKHQYVLEAEYLDRHIGDLIEMLKNRGLYDDTMIIITSDHGQAFNEHGFMYHGIYLYDELSRIPLIVKYPGSRKFKRREGYQSLVNIPDLIHDVIGSGDDSRLTTRTAFSEAYGNTDRPPASYKHRMGYVNGKYEKSRKALYRDGYKLTVNGTDGSIEEFMHGNKDILEQGRNDKYVLKEMLGIIDGFKGGESFRMPRTRKSVSDEKR